MSFRACARCGEPLTTLDLEEGRALARLRVCATELLDAPGDAAEEALFRAARTASRLVAARRLDGDLAEHVLVAVAVLRHGLDERLARQVFRTELVRAMRAAREAR